MAKSAKQETKKRYSSDSFLEAFRDLGSGFLDTFKDKVIKDTGKNIFNSSNNNLNSSTNSRADNSELFSREKNFEKKYQQQTQRQVEIVRKEERIVYTRAERDLQLQVQALQHEIQQLVKASNAFDKELEIASFSVPREAGLYHIAFFEKLRTLIKALRSKIQESSYWLGEWNNKAQKKNYYWGQAKKHGSSFMLHNDRQVATQTG